jgi:cholesterol transport system auxiliary component
MNRRPFLLMTPSLLAACGGSLLPKPAAAPARYTLDDGQAAAASSVPAGPVVLMATLHALPGFDSPRMLYLRQPQVLEAYAQSEWVDTPVQMLAPLLQRALLGSGAFAAVLQAPSAARADWQLEVELVRLQQDFMQSPSRTRLTLRAVLVHSLTRKVIGAREFDESVAATSEDAAGGAHAARQAAVQAVTALARFCAEQVKRPA